MSNKNELPIFQELVTYFQNQADAMEAVMKGTAIFGNRTDAGELREDNLFKFLSRHLPKRCEILKGGFIFDSKGQKSKQIDLIVTNDLTLQFKQFDGERLTKSFNCIEGCYAAISVKTSLDKTELVESLENLGSIPPMPYLKISSNVTNAAQLTDQIPQKIIFAYRGIDGGTLMEHLKEYITTNDTPLSKQPDMIIVNNQYHIMRIGVRGSRLTDGTFIRPNDYVLIRNEKVPKVAALSLYFLISRIQTVSTMGSFTIVDFEKYDEQMGIASKN